MLGLEFLRFLDGLEEGRRAQEAARRHQEVLDRITQAAVVATDRYDEKRVFSEYFPEEAKDVSGLPATSDADVDFDYSGVEWAAPDEDEMALLQRMLEDDSVTLPAAAFADPQPDLPPALPDGSAAIEQIETDREWV